MRLTTACFSVCDGSANRWTAVTWSGCSLADGIASPPSSIDSGNIAARTRCGCVWLRCWFISTRMFPCKLCQACMYALPPHVWLYRQCPTSLLLIMVIPHIVDNLNSQYQLWSRLFWNVFNFRQYVGFQNTGLLGQSKHMFCHLHSLF